MKKTTKKEKRMVAEDVAMLSVQIAACYVDLADQLLAGQKLPGIQKNRDIAEKFGIMLVGEEAFREFVKIAAGEK